MTLHQQSNPSDKFILQWTAFYLNPNLPKFPGMMKQEMDLAKFGPERMAAIHSHLTSVGAGEGIAFRFGGKAGNTRDSHRLLWYAGQVEQMRRGEKANAPASTSGVGIQTRVVENLFRAYFEDEQNITDPIVLSEAGVGAGLDSHEVDRLLASDQGGREVDLEAMMAAQRLVSGVPFFLIQGKYAVTGANEPDVFLRAFQQVKGEEKR